MSEQDTPPIRARATRYYDGLWGVIARYLKVPRGGPRLPSDPEESYEVFHPAPGFLRCLKLWFWLAFLLLDGALLAGWIVLFVAIPWLALLLLPVTLVLLVVPEFVIYVALHLRYDATWYLLTPRSLHLRRGIWVIQEMTITYANVQNLRVRSGPVQRLFGIEDVLVETAGAGAGTQDHPATISNQGLLEGVADASRIRDLIMARVRTQQGAGLGDEPSAGVVSPPHWSPQHLALLREIREVLATARLDT
ncbi:MAG: PH domain-containing protein [bacterium]|nr:PH domain-containing protein [bacterium]